MNITLECSFLSCPLPVSTRTPSCRDCSLGALHGRLQGIDFGLIENERRTHPCRSSRPSFEIFPPAKKKLMVLHA